MTVRESWLVARDRLANSSVADAGLEAEVILRHALGLGRAEFFAALGDEVLQAQGALAESLVRRRASGEPLAYILGSREFYGLDFWVNPDVLVPRQETELLVDKVLEFCAARPSDRRLAIADIGTGSGAIAVAIAKNLPHATIYATDSSRSALVVTEVNRRRHQVADRVHLRRGDLLEALEAPVDVVVSNPPYVRARELAGLPREVRREPASALDGGADGLEMIRLLLRQAPDYVRPGGLLAVEIAPGQLDPVTEIARTRFPRAAVSHELDLSGMPRVVKVSLR